MGAPKALIPYRGKTFVEHLLEVTRHERVGMMRIVVGAHADEIRGKMGAHAAKIVVNADWAKGQLSSIQAAIRSLPEGATEGMILCLVDHPIVSAELVAKLVAEFDSSGKAIVPQYFAQACIRNCWMLRPKLALGKSYGSTLQTLANLRRKKKAWSSISTIPRHSLARWVIRTRIRIRSSPLLQSFRVSEATTSVQSCAA